jgi:hypothetical protein
LAIRSYAGCRRNLYYLPFYRGGFSQPPPGIYQKLKNQSPLFPRQSQHHPCHCTPGLLKSTILFFAVSFLLGFSRSGRNQLYAPVVKGLSGLEDASPYYAISPFLMLPVSAGLPVAVGSLLDCFSAWKAFTYQVTFYKSPSPCDFKPDPFF